MATMSKRERHIKVWDCQCQVCGYTWTTRDEEPPRRCPNHDCRSTLWDREPVQWTPQGKPGHPAPPGRPRAPGPKNRPQRKGGE